MTMAVWYKSRTLSYRSCLFSSFHSTEHTHLDEYLRASSVEQWQNVSRTPRNRANHNNDEDAAPDNERERGDLKVYVNIYKHQRRKKKKIHYCIISKTVSTLWGPERTYCNNISTTKPNQVCNLTSGTNVNINLAVSSVFLCNTRIKD